MCRDANHVCSAARECVDCFDMRMASVHSRTIEIQSVESAQKHDKTNIKKSCKILAMFAPFFLINRNVQGCKPCVQCAMGVCRLFFHH